MGGAHPIGLGVTVSIGWTLPLLLLPPSLLSWPRWPSDCSLSVSPCIRSTKLFRCDSCDGCGVGMSTMLFRFGMDPRLCDVTGAQAALLLMAAI
uniref:Putative secreted protein n=1 Tax=Anopheles darlingi TaxID=43151 RepID=A0A2M4DIL9_ANODA